MSVIDELMEIVKEWIGQVGVLASRVGKLERRLRRIERILDTSDAEHDGKGLE